MVEFIKNVFKNPKLKKQIGWSIFYIILLRLVGLIPIPTINRFLLSDFVHSGGLISTFDLLSGGALNSFSILALGLVPLINANMLIHLTTNLLPFLQRWRTEGAYGKYKIKCLTNCIAIALACFMSFGGTMLLVSCGVLVKVTTARILFTIVSLLFGCIFQIWISEKISKKGLIEGSSLIILTNILYCIPMHIDKIHTLKMCGHISSGHICCILLFTLFIVTLIYFVSLVEVKLNIVSIDKMLFNRNTQYHKLSLNVIGTIVTVLIFVTSFLALPTTLIALFPDNTVLVKLMTSIFSPFVVGSWTYYIFYLFLVFVLTLFTNLINFNPKEISKDLARQSLIIPSRRPGKETEKSLWKLLYTTSIITTVVILFVDLLPNLLVKYTSFYGLLLGSSTLIISVTTIKEIVDKLKVGVKIVNYKGFLK